MGSTGAADLIANGLLRMVAQDNPVIALVMVLVITMTLSDFMNNAATAAVMCPIAIGIAFQVDASPDSFLMAVAIGASCAMLTPIGHQNNTLILGPGGFRFGDYWRVGLPLNAEETLARVLSCGYWLTCNRTRWEASKENKAGWRDYPYGCTCLQDDRLHRRRSLRVPSLTT